MPGRESAGGVVVAGGTATGGVATGGGVAVGVRSGGADGTGVGVGVVGPAGVGVATGVVGVGGVGAGVGVRGAGLWVAGGLGFAFGNAGVRGLAGTDTRGVKAGADVCETTATDVFTGALGRLDRCGAPARAVVPGMSTDGPDGCKSGGAGHGDTATEGGVTVCVHSRAVPAMAKRSATIAVTRSISTQYRLIFRRSSGGWPKACARDALAIDAPES